MKKLESLGYAAMVSGAIADQVSTRVVLSHPEIYESNPLTRQLMAAGLWLLFDIVAISLMIGVLFVILRKWKYTDKWTILAFPYVYGIIRFGAGIWNIGLFYSVIGGLII